MRRLFLTSATSLLAFLLLVPPAWAGWVWPLRGEVITPYRNGGDPYASGQHRGIDIAGGVGATVVAAASGEVRFAGTAGSSGVTVSVRTEDGRYDTSYLHLSSTAVREGDRVAAGDAIGTVGTTGTRSAAAPHLHFGVRDAGSRHAYHDPLGFIPPPTASQPPREAPAPQPAPVPVAPAPAPVHAPAGRRIPLRAPAQRRVPLPAPSPRRVPAPSQRRVPAGAPRRVPVASPGRVPEGAPVDRRVPVGAPSPHRVPVGAPSRHGVSVGAPDPHGPPLRTPAGSPAPMEAPAGRSDRIDSPVDGPGGPSLAPDVSAGRGPLVASGGPARQGQGLPTHARNRANPMRQPSTSGPDLGLLLACLGLLAAAALLGLTGDGRKATRRTGHRIGRALQPILGRR